jgi:hypothetical protein
MKKEMKKIYFYAVTLLCMTAGLQSCQLESEVYDAINAGMYPATARDARDLVTANAYGPFQNNEYSGALNVASGMLLMSDVATDYFYCSWNNPAWNDKVWANFDKMQSYTTKGWNNLNAISKMTLCIDRIEGIDMDASLKNRYIGELRCGRGFMAFLVWDSYGPIIVADLETLKNPLEEKILPRLSEEETRQFIETELTEAAKVLPGSYKKGDADYGRFTAGLCHALLMKFYMQSRQWGKAIAEGRELMKSEYGYTLVTDKGGETTAYANIFTQANEKNTETIWAVNCEEGYQIHLWYPHALPGNLVESPQGSFTGGWGGYKMLWDFFKTFEPDDERTSVIISEYSTGSETYNETSKGVGGNSLADGVVPLKYKIEPNVGDHCVTDWIIYRYADVLTLLAEAIVHDGNAVTGEAIGLLNQVRTRAGLPAYISADFSGVADFIDKLLWERAHEFWFEGCRRQDLIRNDKYVEVMAKKCTDNGMADIISGRGTQFHVFPLPESVIIEGQGQIKQNEGY